MTQIQENLGSYTASQLKKEALEIVGHIDHIGWSNGKPYLYFCDQEKERIPLSLLLGYHIRLEIQADRVCTNCGKSMDENPPCPDCSNGPPFTPCVWNPGTRCSFQNCPYQDYKEKNCDQEFIVYLVAKDEIKVGITRSGRAESRWCEQGADHAVAIAVTPNRKLAGVIEDLVGEKFTKTIGSDWYKPLETPVTSLAQAASKAQESLIDSVQHYYRFNGRDPEEIEDDVFDVPSLIEDGRERLGEKVVNISTGETREGEVIGIRGSNIATSKFIFNSKSHKGRKIRLKTDSSLTEGLQ